MPVIVNTTPTTVRAANRLMAMSFFPRAKKWIFPNFCAMSVSTSPVEPYVAIGSVPPLLKYSGQLFVSKIPSYEADVPNILFKNAFEIAQPDLEFDQTRTLLKLAPAMGVRVAEFPDYLWAKRLLSGSTFGSQTVVFGGKSYTITMDGQPLFSASHATSAAAGTTQNNILQGHLPNTNAGITGQDIGVTANQMVQDLQTFIAAVQAVTDTAGMPLFPNLDPRESVKAAVPPILYPGAMLAFKTVGVIGGTSGSSSGATTNVAANLVKDVVSSGLLGGFVDPEGNGTTLVSPVNPTDYYFFVDNDWVKPFYFQTYRPPKDDEMFPRGYDAGAAVDAVLKADNGITVDEATAFASTRVDTTFNKIGANADEFTIRTETFLVSARLRGNVAYGPWFLSWRVKPVGGS